MEVFTGQRQAFGRVISILALMSSWNLLIIGGSAHLVDLDSEVIEISGFGSFPGKAIKNQKIGTEFDLFGEKSLSVEY